VGRWETRLDWEEPLETFRKRVLATKRSLEAGEVFQLVVARYRYRFSGDVWTTLAELKKRVSANYY